MDSDADLGDDTQDVSDPLETHHKITIQLQTARQRLLGVAAASIAIGVLMLLELGLVAQWIGAILIAFGAFRAAQVVQSLIVPAGTIAIDPQSVTLPRGLHRGGAITAARSEVTAVYFLRRSVPWNRSAPVLVVELGDRAIAYPRDWFASEADQRHLVHALLRGRDVAAAG